MYLEKLVVNYKLVLVFFFKKEAFPEIYTSFPVQTTKYAPVFLCTYDFRM